METQEPISREIRAYWFTLPIDRALFEEMLGIDVDRDDYHITDKELPFADEIRENTPILELNELYEMYQELPDGIREEYKEFLAYFESLEELYNYRKVIIPYPDCRSMIDVARRKSRNDPAFRDLSEDFQEYYFDYEAYADNLKENGCFVETEHGIFEIPE